MCFPGPLLLVSALFRWPCSISIHLFPRSVTAGARPFLQAMRHFYSFVSQVCHCWCPQFSAGDATTFICFPGLSLLMSALFRWPCSISIHVFPGSVTGAAALFRWPCSISIHLFLVRVLSFGLSGLVPALLFSALFTGTGSPVKGSCSFVRGACPGLHSCHTV